MQIYVDTETVGLCGNCKLIQFSVGKNSPVQFIRLYRDRIEGDLAGFFKLLEDPTNTIVAFNASFDLWHLYRVAHTRLHGLPLSSPERPVQPFRAAVIDLYNHAVQSGPFSPWAFCRKNGKRTAMLRRVPSVAADLVASRITEELEQILPSGVRVTCSHHRVPGSRDLVTLSWVTSASMSLKSHAKHYGATGVVTIEGVWPLPPKDIEKPWLPDYDETAYAPTETQCEAIMAGSGPATEAFYAYARKDIEYLWLVEDGLKNPQPSHHDAAVEIVSYTRYYGFYLKRSVLEATRDAYAKEVKDAETLLAGINLRSSVQKLAALKKHEPWLTACNKVVLSQLIRDGGDSPAVPLAKAFLSHGRSKQRLDQVNKIMSSSTGRAHPSLRVMGTSTGRLAGCDGLNWQGISQAAKMPDGTLIGVRAALEAGMGGDFSSFEIAIAASAWNDPQMLADLDSGADLHLTTAVAIHPDLTALSMTYEEAMKAKADKNHPHHTIVTRARTEAKRVVFGLLYGCGPEKCEEVMALRPGEGEKVLEKFFGRYQGCGAFRKDQEKRFLTADTEHWDRDSVAEMADTATDLIGFKRSFKFEADLADLFWRLGGSGISTGITGNVVRSKEKGSQTIDGAVRSALLGGALAIQQAVCRAAINLPIQATGANLTKILAARIWRRCGHPPCMNIHDELVFANHPNLDVEAVLAEARAFEKDYRGKVKHIAFDAKRISVWADK